MARVKYQPGECDPNFKIEDGIRETLRNNSTAEVSASVIETLYDLVDAEANPVKGTLEDMCEAIAKTVGSQFSLVGENAVFKKPHGR